MPITAEPGLWKLDDAHSSVAFKHKTIWGLVTVKGRFTSVSGEGEVLPDGAARGTLTIDAASLDTKHAKRDAHLRSGDFFDIERHPSIVFAARSITPGTDGAVRVEGTLTVRDTTRPLTFAARATKAGPDAVSLSAELPVDRADFGLNWNQLGMLRGLATVSVDLRFQHKSS